MRNTRFPSLLLAALLAAPAIAVADTDLPVPGGLVIVDSAHDVPATTERLVGALEAKGMTVFERVDHAAGAEAVGLSLPPTQLVIFGNPKVGTKLMQCDPHVAIELPLKALIWEDAEGSVRLAYNNPGSLAERYSLAGCQAVLEKVAEAMSAFAEAATSP
jgi:uncharacterized protein (DUF302 family)